MADRKRPKYKAPLGSQVKKPKKTRTPKEKRALEREKRKAPQQTAKRKKTDAAKKDIPTKKAAKKTVVKKTPPLPKEKVPTRAQRVIGDIRNPNIVGGKKGSRSKYYAALAALVAAGTAAWQQTKPSFGSRMRSSIKSAEGSPKDKPGKHDPYTGYYGPLAPLETKEVKDTRPKKTGTYTGLTPEARRGMKKPSVISTSLKVPESELKKDSRKDFAAYNKPGSKLGMKMDDILRGAFSFMGALPKSTAKDKWKNK